MKTELLNDVYATNEAGTSYYGSNFYVTDNIFLYLPIVSSLSIITQALTSITVSSAISDDKGYQIFSEG